MSNLVDHAVRELDLIGCEEGDFTGRKEVLDIIDVFSKQGHSGSSAAWVTAVVEKLMRYENLSPLTNSPEEWVLVGENLWQNKRNSACFSTDGGLTYTSVDDDAEVKTVHTTKHL